MVQRENRLASMGFIVSFYGDTETLTDAFASYLNIWNVIKAIPNQNQLSLSDHFDKVTSPEQKTAIATYAGEIRFFVTRTFLKFSSLKDEIKEFKKDFEPIEDLYKKIAHSALLPSIEDTEKYILALNKAFVKGVVAEFLIKSQEVYSNYAEQSDEFAD